MIKSDISNYVVSSRIRLARNLARYPFPNKMGFEDGLRVIKEVSEPLEKHVDGKLIMLKDLEPIEIKAYTEKHLISNALAENVKTGAMVLNKDATLSVMINEEDHIRIQVIKRSLDLESAYELADKVDDLISENSEIAFDIHLGYLTSCPTNLGTAMRASVMMFLPALTINRTINNVIFSSSKDALVLRGVYGEGTQAEGYMYQLSNQYSLGLNEKEIINMVKNQIYKVAEAEEIARETLLSKNRVELTDMIMRAWGILTNAYKIDTAEFMQNMSLIKLGASLGILKVKTSALDEIIVACRPANLSLRSGRKLDALERDIYRAEFLRDILPKMV